MATDASRVGWLYQARRVLTRTANAGVVVIRLSLAAGQIARLITLRMEGAATSSAIVVELLDEDGATHSLLGSVAAGANRIVQLPSIGVAATASGNVAASTDLLMGPGQYLKCYTDAGPAQGETVTIAVTLLLYNVSTVPTWDTTGSTATVSLAANTIAAETTPVVVNPP